MTDSIHSLEIQYSQATLEADRLAYGNLLARAVCEQNPKQSLAICREIFAIALSINHGDADKFEAAACLCTQTRAYYLLGDYDGGLACVAKYLQVAPIDHPDWFDLLNLTGATYLEIGDLAKSKDFYEQSLEFASDLQAIDVINGIASVYVRLGQFKEALEHHLRALALAHSAGHVRKQSLLLSGCCYDCNQIGRFAEGVVYGREAWRLAVNQIPRAQVIAAHNLGVSLRGLGQYPEAEKYFYIALQISQETNLPILEVELLQSFGRLSAVQNLNDEAIHYWQLALNKAQQLKALWHQYTCHEALSTLYESLGDVKTALFHYKAFHQIKEEVVGEQVKQQIERTPLEERARISEKVSEFYISQTESLREEIARQEITRQSLEASELRYRHLFFENPVALLEADISELRLALRPLQASGVVDWDAYISQNPDFVREAARLIRIVAVNDTAVSMYKLQSNQDMLGPLDQLMRPDSYKYFAQELAAIAKGLHRYECEISDQTMTGEHIDVLVHMVIPPEEAGHTTIISLVDITKRKKAEAQIRQIQKELEQRVEERTAELIKINEDLHYESDMRQMLLETAPVIIAVLTPEGQIVYINPYMETMTGIRLVDVVHQDWFDTFLPEKQRQKRRQDYYDHKGIDSSQKFTYPIVGGNGRHYHIEWSIRSLTDVPGTHQGHLLVGTDVSDQLIYQQNLWRYSQRLEILKQIQLAILSKQTAPAIAETCLSHLNELVPARATAVILTNEDITQYNILAINPTPPRQLPTITHNSSLNRQILHQLSAENLLLLTNQDQIAQVLNIYDAPINNSPIKTLLLCALKIPDRFIGFIAIITDKPEGFTEEEQEITQEIANSVSLAMQNSLLLQTTEEWASELLASNQLITALNNVAIALGQSAQSQTVIETLGQQLENLGIHCAIALIDEEGSSELKLQYASLPQNRLLEIENNHGFSMNNIILDRNTIIGSNNSQFISNMFQATLEMFHTMPSNQIQEMLSLADITPQTNSAILTMQVEGEMIGSLFLWGDRLFVNQMPVYSIFADQAGIAIRNARLLKNERVARDRAETLREVASILTATGQMSELLHEILAQLDNIISFDSASLMLIDGDSISIVARRGTSSGITLHQTMPINTLPGIELVVTSAKPVIVDDTHNSQSWVRLPTDKHIRSWMGIPLVVQEGIIGVLNLNHQTPGFYTQQDANWAQAFANQGAMAIENSRLFNQIQSYASDLEGRIVERTKELVTLYEVVSAVNEHFDLDTLMEKVLTQTLKTINAANAAIYLYESPDQFRLLSRMGSNLAFPEEVNEGAALHSILSQVYHSMESSVGSIHVFEGEIDSPNHNYVAVPMGARGNNLGVVIFYVADVHMYQMEDVVLLGTIAEHIGLAIENSRLRKQAEQVAVMEERGRLARELHDSVTQMLYSLNLFAHAAKGRVEQTKEANKLGEYLADISSLAQQSLKEMRLLLYELTSDMHLQKGLEAALTNRLESVEQRGGISTRIQVSKLPKLSSMMEGALFRIAQEALNNALKHAQAKTVIVRIEGSDSDLAMHICDDGCGFDPANIQGGLGINIMRERAENIGGNVQIQSEVGKGTCVEVFVTLSEKE